MLVMYSSRRPRYLVIGLGLVSVHLPMVNRRGDLDGIHDDDDDDDYDDTDNSDTCRNGNRR